MACDVKTLITAGYASGFGKLSYRHLKEAILASACSPQVAASNWAARVVANGGAAPAAATTKAISTFLFAIGGLSSRIYHLGVFAPDSLIAMRTPVIKTFGVDPWTAVVAGTGGSPSFTSAGYLSGTDGINATMYDTGVFTNLIPSFSVSNGGMTVYCSDNAASIVKVNAIAICGCYHTTSAFEIVVCQINNHSNCQCYSGLDALDVVNPDAQGGFFSLNRTSSTLMNFYYGSSTRSFASLGTKTTTSVAPPLSVESIYIGGTHQGAPSPTLNPLQQRLSFIAVHDGFSSADNQILFNAAQALRVSFGGGFL